MKKLLFSPLFIIPLILLGLFTIFERNTQITVINDAHLVVSEGIISKGIDKYPGFVGYSWLDDNNFLLMKTNSTVPYLTVDNEYVKTTLPTLNIFFGNTDNNVHIPIGNHDEFQSSPLLSPNRKVIFYNNLWEEAVHGYFADSSGTVLTYFDYDYIDSYDYSEAQWISNSEIIVPSHAISGFAVIDVDGNITRYEDVENQIMSNEDPLYGLSLTSPYKIGSLIYYITLNSSTEKTNSLKVYDIETKTNSIFIEEEVFDYYFLANTNQFLINTFNERKFSNELILVDTDGNFKKSLIDGHLLGISISKDESKISYIRQDFAKEGVYIFDLEKNEEHLVALGSFYAPVAFSPSGNKIMVHSNKEQDSSTDESMYMTNIINLK